MLKSFVSRRGQAPSVPATGSAGSQREPDVLAHPVRLGVSEHPGKEGVSQEDRPASYVGLVLKAKICYSLNFAVSLKTIFLQKHT